MAAEQIDRTQWAQFFESAMKSLIGKRAEIEVASDGYGKRQIVKLKNPLALPAPSVAASHEAAR